MLNNQGRKIIKEKIGNDVEETNHYYNIDESESHKFDDDWRGANNNMKFLENHQKYMQALNSNSQPRQLGLGYDNRREENRQGNQRRQEYRPIQNDYRENGSRGDGQSRSNFSQKGSVRGSNR